jgi:hypothetical protein
MSRVLSLAGFEVTLIGRFWVIPEAGNCARTYLQEPSERIAHQQCPNVLPLAFRKLLMRKA